MFTDANGHATPVTVGSTGKFSVQLAAGKYHVAGRTLTVSQENENGTSAPIPRQPPAPVQVRAGQTAWITAFCAYS